MNKRQVVRVLVALALVASACSSGGQADQDDVNACGAERVFGDDVAPLTVAGVVSERWSVETDEATFSSPRTADLNGDGVLDIVQGFGQDTLGAKQSSVIATDGATGEQIWRSTGHEDVIGSAVFAALGGDDTVDVVIGGRRGGLLALDGATGSVLWTFDDQGGLWFNFYTSQLLPDQNGDGVVEVLAVNGGLVFDEPEEGTGMLDPDERHLGTVFVLSGADGSVLVSVPVPDRGESYMSPVVLPGGTSGDVELLIGTGGETLPGGLWKWSLAALIERDAAPAEELVNGGSKGVIASPVVADMNADCVADIVVQAFDGTVSLIDGVTGDHLWVIKNAGFETYSTPTLGYFVGDDSIPDVFASVANGVWPEYESSDYLLIDGATGEIVWRETRGTFAPSGFVAADVNGDGRDEVIFGVNDIGADTQQMFVLDPSRLELHPLGEPLPQTAFSAPWIGDLDADGQLDLIVTASSYQPPMGPAMVRRLVLAWPAPDAVTWGGYLGTVGTGSLGADD